MVGPISNPLHGIMVSLQRNIVTVEMVAAAVAAGERCQLRAERRTPAERGPRWRRKAYTPFGFMSP